MCGRTACSLDKKSLQRASSVYCKKNNGLPRWVELHKNHSYTPSYNMSPGQFTPVLVMDEKVMPYGEAEGDIAICPMRWGLIPNWYKGSLGEYNLKTNNSRLEGILEKPTFKGPLSSGKRCVVLAEGFFEWKPILTGKCPFFFFFPQENLVSMQNRNWEKCVDDLWSSKNGWRGPRLMTMAGIYDVWRSPESENIYSYSIITMPASKTMSFVHTRMPAILDGVLAVKEWLYSSKIPYHKALSNLKSVDKLEVFPVPAEVNNTKNNSVSCVLPLKFNEDKPKKKKQQPPKGATLPLPTWVNVTPRSSSASPMRKRQKTDE